MKRNHDESKDLRSFSKVGRVNRGDKTLRTPKGSLIGIKMWGKIDFLIHYCGWTLVWDNHAFGNRHVENDDDNKVDYKKIKKEHKLANKKEQ